MRQKKQVLSQFSTINALLEKVYDGEMALKELRNHGDFGIGTVNGLDGELIFYDGNFYQVKGDGKVYKSDENTKTPFAITTFFNQTRTINICEINSFTHLDNLLDSLIPTQNIFYAIKIVGNFKYLKARSVYAQEKPYKTLAEIAKGESIFEYTNIKGTAIGFRLPSYLDKINVSGYHLHFLDDSISVGGHVLEMEIETAEVHLDFINNLLIELPHNKSFYDTDLSKDNRKEIEEVEN